MLAIFFLFLFVGCVPPEEEALEIKINSITPTSGSINGGFDVKIEGENFTFIEEVTINGTSCQNLVSTGTLLTCKVPAVSDPGEAKVLLRSKGNRTGSTTFTYTVASFTVTAFSPQYAVPAGQVALSIQGTNFSSGMSVTVGGTPCTNVKFLSTTLLQCTLPAKTSGPYHVVVSNKFDSITAKTQFTYSPLPTITSVSPIEGPISGGTNLTISGTNFLPSATVQMGRGSCMVTSVALTGDSITCFTPVGNAGLTNLTVTQPGKLNVTRTNAYTYLTPPTVLSVSPSGGPIAGGTTITIKGQNFTAPSTVKIGALNCSNSTWVNAETITCVTPTNSPNTGIYDVTVTDSKNLSSTLGDAFSYQEGPIIADVSPKGVPRTLSSPITITGSNFQTGATVKIVAPNSAFVCPVTSTTETQIVCQTPLTTLSGDVDIIVTNPDSQTDTWDNFGFRNRPTILTVSPLGGPMNLSDDELDLRTWEVIIFGTDFSNPSVTIGGKSCVVDTNETSSSKIACTLNSSASFGHVTVTVTNGDEQSASKTNGFFYNNGPEVRSVKPVLPIGGPPAGGTAITIYGKSGDQTRKFFGTPYVKFNEEECLSVVVAPDGESLNCVTPAMPEGIYTIAINNPDSQKALIINGFKFAPPPTISSIEPNYSVLAGESTIKIIGDNFDPEISVKLGEKDCPVVSGSINTDITPNELQCVVPPGTGVVDVTVTNPDTQSVTDTLAFTYRAPPTITAVSPTFGKDIGGGEVTVTGTNFFPEMKIFFGSSECLTVEMNTNDTTTAKCASVPAGGDEDVKIKVENKEGQFFETSLAIFSYLKAPEIDSITPASGGFKISEVTIVGNNFYNGMVVKIGDKLCTDLSGIQIDPVTSRQFFTCKVPMPDAAGKKNVVVENKDTRKATLIDGYEYISPPVITSISRSIGKMAGGDTVIITGSFFDSGVTVTIGGDSCAIVGTPTASELTCITSNTGPSGAKTVRVTNPDTQFDEEENRFTFLGLATLDTVSPSAGPIAGNNEVTITGTNFIAGTTVEFVINGSDHSCPVGTISETQIKCTVPVPPGGTTFPYTADIKITNITGQTELFTFKYIYRAAPTLGTITNESGSSSIPKASKDGMIYINGTGFIIGAGGSTVLIGTTPCASVNVLSDSLIECKVPNLSSATHDVKVKNPEGQVSDDPVGLEVIAKPTVTNISVPQGTIAGGLNVTVTGTNFVTNATVSIGGALCATPVVTSSTTITCTTGANSEGLKNVVVTNPDLTTSTHGNGFAGFTYMAQPAITSVTPNGGPPGLSIPVKIAGTSFYSGVTVLIGTKTCTVSAVSYSEITCSAPTDLTAGNSYDVVVTNLDNQTRTLLGGFTSSFPPTISIISPNVGPIGGNTSVSITGTNFKPGSLVKFNNVSAASVTFNTEVSLTVVTPASILSGVVSVTVTNPDGQSALIESGFVYLKEPKVTSVSPNQGPLNGGTTVTITGTDFFAGAKVKVGTGDCTSVVVVSSTSITCVLPVQTAGAKTVEVENVDGQKGSLVSGYTYFAAPVISGISPTSGSTTGGTLLTISGSGFRSGSTILIGTTPCVVGVNTITNTEIKCTTREGSAGKYKIKVTNSDGQQFETTTELFTYRGIPTLTNVSPNLGPSAGGTTVTVTGTNFFSGDKIVFGNPSVNPYVTFDCDNTTWVSSTTMTCTTPAKAAGVYDVMVKSSDATTSYKQFTYRAAPGISDVSPSSGVQAGGTRITIKGTGIDAQTVVKIGGKTCTSSVFNPNPPLSITCSTPASSVGAQTVALSVLNIDGQSTISASGFTYTAIPIIKFKVGTVSPTPPNPDEYGTTSTNVTHTFTLENIGEGTSSPINVTVTGTNSAAWFKATDNCQGQQLAPNQSCTIQMTLLGGILSAGPYEAVLNATADTGGTTTNVLKGSVP